MFCKVKCNLDTMSCCLWYICYGEEVVVRGFVFCLIIISVWVVFGSSGWVKLLVQCSYVALLLLGRDNSLCLILGLVVI